jgi:mRNA interferase RelE/StbE
MSITDTVTMAIVLLSAKAQEQMDRLPGGMLRRVNDVLERLERWPQVSGAKPLRGDLAGSYRVRCGDWRVVFRPRGQTVVVTAVDNRRDVYE